MRISVIDSHTGGEPTRVVLGGIALDGETMFDRRHDFETRFDHLRSGIILEPRGSDVLVGALLTEPVNEGSAAGVIFFNNAGFLGMCGHGTIGVVETLRHLGRMEPGTHHLDTPVGTIAVELRPNHEVVLTNVSSYRLHENITVEVDGHGKVTGDVAYGGNWFFVVHHPSFEINLARSEELTDIAQAIKAALIRHRITGEDGAEIDHVELAGPSDVADSRNFVLCPGGAYDRSPCGTGTSAKMACLAARGELLDGVLYRQESITGSIFQGSARTSLDRVIPTIIGRAHITAESTLIFEDDDPLRWGLNL
jgi:4-hydroxyproline epimerase